jgi:hypothetical protein
LRRGQLVHGAADPILYLLALRDYSLKDRARTITCPVFVCNAEGDDISKSAPQLAGALTGDKEFVTFTAAEGAGDHAKQAHACSITHDRSAGWTAFSARPDQPRRPIDEATVPHRNSARDLRSARRGSRP